MEIPLIAKWAGLTLAAILASIMFFIFLFELGLLSDSNCKSYPMTIEKYQQVHEKNTCLPPA